MEILKTKTAPSYKRDAGITSYLLASARTCGAVHLGTTVVTIEPGGVQRIHTHEPEQVYFILEGSGLMTVGEETAQVCVGDCVFVPSASRHGIKNESRDALRYFSASAPSFDISELEEWWPLSGDPDRVDDLTGS